ncbi:rod-binding protein [Tepidamorphus sp. 3E244]|uniref:rod-binding protein n=1 Tax=Tepidamorphus sp. 3E244 TaxID=3385498 RepID=UPI0038FCEB0F
MNPVASLQTSAAYAQGIATPQATADLAKAQAQGREFEGVFLATMLNQMFSGLKTDGPFHGGHAEEQFRGILVEEMGNSIAKAGGIGIADAVARELIAIQEGNGR